MKRKSVSFAQLALPAMVVLFLLALTASVLSQADSLGDIGGRKLTFAADMVALSLLLLAGCAYSLCRRAGLESFLCAVFVIVGIGAAFQFLFEDYSKHMTMIFAGIFIGVVVYLIWRRMNGLNNALFLLVLFGIFALLVLNILFGFNDEPDGARLWVNVGLFSFQPGEVVKILLIVLGAASYRNAKRGALYCLASGASCAVLMLLRDVGGAAVIFAIFLLMSYLLFDNRLLSGGIMLAAIVAFFYMVSVLPYAMERVSGWGQAMVNPASTQQRQYILAVLLGGFDGLGLEHASWFTEVFSAESDGAAAGVMAVYGVPMAGILLAAYAGLTSQAAWSDSVYPSGYFILAQMGMYVAVQVLLNLAGSLDVLFFTGIVCPMGISNGGTATICSFMLLGLSAAALNPYVARREEVYTHAC